RAGIARGEQDREERDNGDDGERNPQEEEHEVVRDRQQPLDQPQPAAQRLIQTSPHLHRVALVHGFLLVSLPVHSLRPGPHRAGLWAGCRSGTRCRVPGWAAISAAIGEGLKPLTTSHTPSENSQAATGRVAIAVHAVTCPMLPLNSAAMTAARSRGAPMSPTIGMIRGTSRDRYIKVPSSRALMHGMRVCPSSIVQL